jgi:TonB-dependent SusC/RagA subfamily outer membrane receptor
VDVGRARVAAKVTGSLTTIKEDRVNAGGALTLADLLRGRVPGLQVITTASGVTYRLRGPSSLNADEAPLFIVNGVPVSAADVDRAMSGVMMEDVRQVDVLKDVASTSIFGSRGAGGVIIITTRR